MDTVYEILKWVHIAAWVVALVGYAMTLPNVRINGYLAHGVSTALVLGIILTGIASASDAVDDPNNAKVGVKLLIALVATGLAHGTRKRPAPNVFAHVVAGLIVLNVVIAYAWR